MLAKLVYVNVLSIVIIIVIMIVNVIIVVFVIYFGLEIDNNAAMHNKYILSV